MIKVTGAVIKKQGLTFAVVAVKNHVFNTQHDRQEAQISFASIFPGMPIVLMARSPGNSPQYWGRRDIIQFLSNVHPSRLPWREFTFN